MCKLGITSLVNYRRERIKPYAFLTLRSERSEYVASLLMGNSETRGITPESSKLELEEKVRAKSSAFPEDKAAVKTAFL